MSTNNFSARQGTETGRVLSQLKCQASSYLKETKQNWICIFIARSGCQYREWASEATLAKGGGARETLHVRPTPGTGHSEQGHQEPLGGVTIEAVLPNYLVI